MENRTLTMLTAIVFFCLISAGSLGLLNSGNSIIRIWELPKTYRLENQIPDPSHHVEPAQASPGKEEIARSRISFSLAEILEVT